MTWVKWESSSAVVSCPVHRPSTCRVPPLPVQTLEEHGLPSEAKEALAFAVLAYETAHGRPGALPGTTGAARPVVLGSIAPGWRRPLRIW